MIETLSIQSLTDGRMALISHGDRAEVVAVQYGAKVSVPLTVDETFYGLVQELIDNTYIPERHCNCHISPPCNDCVEYGGIREIVSHISEYMKKHSIEVSK